MAVALFALAAGLAGGAVTSRMRAGDDTIAPAPEASYGDEIGISLTLDAPKQERSIAATFDDMGAETSATGGAATTTPPLVNALIAGAQRLRDQQATAAAAAQSSE